MTNEKGSFAYSYNQFNNLMEIKKNGTVNSSFEYDLNGNQKKEVADKEVEENGTTVTKKITTDYIYDKADRLSKLTISDGKPENIIIITNYYNGDGQRIKQEEKVGASTASYVTKYLYDRGNLLFTSDDSA